MAFEGTVTWLAIILFAIQFVWQFPHFWAIGWLSYDEYRKAGFKLVPSVGDEVDRSLGANSLFYAILLIPITAAAFYLGVTDLMATIGVLVVSIWYGLKAYRFSKTFDRTSARKLMFSSFAYLPLVLLIILIGSLV